MKIEVIDTGYFYADGGAMFGAVPKTSWSRRYSSDRENGCILAMRTLLVTTSDGRIILVDNGAGYKHLKLLSYYRFFDLRDLNMELAKRGICPEMITDVILTHLHFDHCGYTTQKKHENDKLTVSYPNARHWVSQAQWNNFLFPNPLEADSYFPENMMAVKKAGLLCLIEDDYILYPGISLCLYEGHTPGQIVPYIQTSERTFVYAGDVIPLAANLSPGWISAYDAFPVSSYSEKIRLLEGAVRDKQVVFFCHDAYTCCSTVKKVNDFYKIDKKISVSESGLIGMENLQD